METSVYTLPAFQVNEEAAVQLMTEHPFATLVTCHENVPFVSHLPFLVERAGGKIKLVGHVARRNPHAKLLEGPAMAVFNGPHAYITPSWYTAGRDVPTWNYAVVHAIGSSRLIDDGIAIIDILRRLTERFEGDSEHAWKFELPADLPDGAAVARAIVGFEIEVERLDAKFKLSQTRTADAGAVIEGLAARSDEQSRAVGRMMQTFTRRR